MLKYDGPLVRKNRELSEFVHEIMNQWKQIAGNVAPWWSIDRLIVKSFSMLLERVLINSLRAREVPYSYPIYGALEPKGSVANALRKR